MLNFHAHVINNAAQRLKGLLSLCEDSLDIALQETPLRIGPEVHVLRKVKAGITASLELIDNEILPMAAEMDVLEDSQVDQEKE